MLERILRLLFRIGCLGLLVVFIWKIIQGLNSDVGIFNFLIDIFNHNKNVLIAFFGVAVAYFEYRDHKKCEKNRELSKYNDRFLSAEVVNSEIHEQIMKEKVKPASSISPKELNEREKYMRFFEELQFAIESGRLNKKQVHYMFGFYAGEVYKYNKLFVEDFYHSCWAKFRTFAYEDYVKNNTHGIKRLYYVLLLRLHLKFTQK